MKTIICLLPLITILSILSCSRDIQKTEAKPEIPSDPSCKIGVYYFPGWKDYDPNRTWEPFPWNPIKAYSDIEPKLGFYKEGEVVIAEQQIDWMSKYGIDFIAYDWYWNKDSKVDGEHALLAFLQSKNKDLLKFSLLWANHSIVPENLGQFTSMVAYWIKNYFNQNQYLKIDDKPVVFIFSQFQLRENGKKFGMTTKDLLTTARDMAKAAGFPGIYFIGGTEGTEGDSFWLTYAADNGYDAVSAYNYQRGPGTKTMSESYQELSDGYAEQWTYINNKSTLPYFVPMTAGWNKKPWGGSSNPLHDNSVSTPDEFEAHLKKAQIFMTRNPEKTKKIGIICAWNEFGEGSYIEPTKKYGFEYLERVKKIFGD